MPRDQKHVMDERVSALSSVLTIPPPGAFPMTALPLNELSATEIARRIAAGEATAEAVVAACLERIAAREPVVGAWAHLDPAYAVDQARRRDRERPAGPLHGVPVAVKDIFDTADMPTGMGSAVYAGHQPRVDASAVAIVRAAGAVVLGKTVTTEFAAGDAGKTANPHDPGRTPGGSSSGSAAAVADRMAPVAFGTQTAGSVIRPASYCGAIGFKPTYGAYARAGVKPIAESLDTIGIICRDLDDAELMDAVLTGRAPAPARPLDHAPRIALCRTHHWPAAEPATVAAVEDAAGNLARAGASVDSLALPEEFATLGEAHRIIMEFEAARALFSEWHDHRDRLGVQIRDRIERGLATAHADYLDAQRRAEAARKRLRSVIEPYDAVLTPSAAGEAPAGLAETGDRRFQSSWTLLHLPCVTIPTHRGPAGLPVGVQLVGHPGRDAALLATARWVQDGLGRVQPASGR
jgi:amidase